MSFSFFSCDFNPLTLPILHQAASKLKQAFDLACNACTSPDPSDHAGKESPNKSHIEKKSKSPSNDENIEVTLQGYTNSTNPLYKKWPYDEMNLDNQTCNDHDTLATEPSTNDEMSLGQETEIKDTRRTLLEKMMEAKHRMYLKYRKITTNKTVKDTNIPNPDYSATPYVSGYSATPYDSGYSDEKYDPGYSPVKLDFGYQKAELKDKLSGLVGQPKHTKKSDSIGTQSNQHGDDFNSLASRPNKLNISSFASSKSPVLPPKQGKYQQFLSDTRNLLKELRY